MHHIQKYFLDATEFFFHYHDYQKEMQALVESLTPLFEKALQIIASSPAEWWVQASNLDRCSQCRRFSQSTYELRIEVEDDVEAMLVGLGLA